MVKLADTRDLGSRTARCAGSSPVLGIHNPSSIKRRDIPITPTLISELFALVRRANLEGGGAGQLGPLGL